MTETDNNSEGQFRTTAEWDMKSILLSQYAIAYTNLVDYIMEPDKTHFRLNAQKSILKLLYPLFPKLYVLGDSWKEKRDYLAYFMKNPQQMHLMECQASFLILQRTMEKLGITKFEKFHLSQSEAYLDQ